jgi:hypothetical protein
MYGETYSSPSSAGKTPATAHPWSGMSQTHLCLFSLLEFVFPSFFLVSFSVFFSFFCFV